MSLCINVTYNPSILSFNSVTATFGNQLDLGIPGNSWQGFDDSTPGMINLFEVSFAGVDDLNTYQAGSFVLATLNFTGPAGGFDSLGIDIVKLGDANGDPLSAVVATPVPLPGSLLLFGSGLTGFIAWGKRKWFSAAV
jgi:hypothetical protein